LHALISPRRSKCNEYFILSSISVEEDQNRDRNVCEFFVNRIINIYCLRTMSAFSLLTAFLLILIYLLSLFYYIFYLNYILRIYENQEHNLVFSY